MVASRESDAAQIPTDAKKKYKPRITALLEKLDRKGTWALKDPRLSLLLPIFLRHLKDPVAVIAYRNPVEVARSLEQRNQLPQLVGMALWEAYVISALRASVGVPRLFVGYDELIRSPATTAACLREALRRAAVADLKKLGETLVVDQGLHHHRARTADIHATATAEQVALWRALEDASTIANAPHELSLHARLVLAEFEDSIQAMRLYD